MDMRQLDRYRCDECGFEADVTRPPRPANTSEETLCCCGHCGAEMKSTAAADERLHPRTVHAAVPLEPPRLTVTETARLAKKWNGAAY